jgi:hypothetical protein
MKKKSNTNSNAIRDSIEREVQAIAAEPASALVRGNISPLGYVN